MPQTINLDREKRESQLNQELMINTLVGEVTRVMLAAPTLESAMRSFFLGLSEITGTNRLALFQIDSAAFGLKLLTCEGISVDSLERLRLGLDFMSGEYPDAIFLNKHIIVDPVDPADPFATVGSQSYAVMPIVSRITSKCWEVRKCNKTECPCYEGHNPYCWSVAGAALDTGATSEDEKRMSCVKCSQFKCEALLWIDTSDVIDGISATAITHALSLCRSMGLVMESFGMYKKLEVANSQLASNNDILSCLNEELNQAQARIERELDHARTIQKGLLPESFPSNFAKDISARYIPAGKVGGDYYDFFLVDDDLVGILVADVSGHGIAAALIMSMFKILLKSLAPTLRSPKKILEHINRVFLEETHSVNYVTVFLAFFNRKTREFVYANAGHTPQVLLYSNGSTQDLKATGLFVGILDDVMMHEESKILDSDTRLLLYTDGLTETKSEHDEMYGFERFKKHIAATSNLSCSESLDLLLEEFNEFRGSSEIIDDITMLFVDL